MLFRATHPWHQSDRAILSAFFALLVACVLFTSFAGVSSTTSVAPSQLGLQDLAGNLIKPFQSRTNAKALVFVFVGRDCPVSNREIPEINRLHRQLADKGVEFWLVHPAAEDSTEAIALHTREFQVACGVLRDPRHELVHAARVKVTPEAAVFSPSGRLLYHGRVSNLYVALGKHRPARTQHDLEEILGRVLAGKPIVDASRPAVGCYIGDLR